MPSQRSAPSGFVAYTDRGNAAVITDNDNDDGGSQGETPLNVCHPLVQRDGIRTLALNTFLGLVGVTSSSVAVALSNSTVLYAELLRSLAEFGAVLLSLLLFFIFPSVSPSMRHRLSYAAAIAVTGAMVVALTVIVLHAYDRIRAPVVTSGIGVFIGMSTASASAIVNFFCTRKNHRMFLRHQSSLFASQWKLFRVKFAANVTIVLAAGGSWMGSHYHWLIYADPIGSLFLAGFVAYSAVNIFGGARQAYQRREPADASRPLQSVAMKS